LEAREIWMRKIFRKEAAAAMCCGEEEGAFSAKLLRKAARARFPKRRP
jgi:hypothetical protein